MEVAEREGVVVIGRFECPLPGVAIRQPFRTDAVVQVGQEDVGRSACANARDTD